MTIGVAANLVALVAVIAYVLWLGRRPTEAVRLRNALLLQASLPGDFDWTPPQFPEGFALERLPPSDEFVAIAERLKLSALPGDWEKALTLAGHLTENARDEEPLQGDLTTTYRDIRNGGGYCADFVKVFLALAHAAGLVARQWAFSFDGFGGHGHTVVEVFDARRGKWLLLDVYNNFHVLDVASGEPLGALEYRDALRGRRSEATMRRTGPGRPGFVHREKAHAYYLRGIDEWYLMWGNAVFSYYAHPAVRWLGRMSRTLAHLAANVVGVQPRIHIYATPENAEQMRRMFSLRRRLLGLAALAVVLTLTLVVQLLSIAWARAPA
jgi:hypothetical protein